MKFEGLKNKRIIKLLKEQVEMREKNSFIENRVKNDEEKIINILRTNGYYFSKVIPKLKKNNNNTGPWRGKSRTRKTERTKTIWTPSGEGKKETTKKN